jgi:Tol biopolymer transport system component
MSYATNLVPGDTNDLPNIFVRDRLTGETKLVSRTPSGAPGNGESWSPSISADGHWIAFQSTASDLIGGDTNGTSDVFLYDNTTDTVTRVSVTSSGGEADGWSSWPAMSADGNIIAYESEASNLVAGDTNTFADVFLLDRETATVTRINVAADGSETNGYSHWPSLSGDGRYTAYLSYASNIVAADSNGAWDDFLYDRETGQTVLISLTSTGQQVDDLGVDWPVLSGDGRYVVFSSASSVLVPNDTNRAYDVFLRDLWDGMTTRASLAWDGEEANDDSWYAYAVDSSGAYVVFWSRASNLVPSDTNHLADLFLRDMARGRTCRISIGSHGEQGDRECLPSGAAITSDGRYVSFSSYASSLAPEAPYGGLFLRDRLTFEDVPLDHWAFYEVGACHMAGVVQGYPDGLYRPDITITRDQMAVYIARALAGPTIPVGPAEPTFPDVPADHWAYDEIEYAVARNVVEGYNDGNYHPDWPVTRAQMAVFIARSVVDPTGEEGLASYTPPATPTFPDLPPAYWCYKHLEYLAEHDIVSGYSDGSYQPAQYVSRDQMAVYVQRAFQLPL